MPGLRQRGCRMAIMAGTLKDKNMKITWTAATFALCAVISAPVMANDGDGPQQCNLRTLKRSYVLAANGFVVVAGVAQPKALIEQIDFNGDGSAVSPNAAVAVNGNAI